MLSQPPVQGSESPYTVRKGLVKDESAAVVPGVAVVATNQGTNIMTTTATNERGLYSLQNLPIGTYSVTFTLAGFNVVKREGIELTGSFVASVNADMKVGAIEETKRARTVCYNRGLASLWKCET